LSPAFLEKDPLEQAAELRLLGLLFERPTLPWREEIARLGPEIRDPDLRRLARASAEESEGGYLALFGPGGRVSPREVAYRGTADPGETLADLGAFYRAFAFAPRSEDPPDHIAVEVGFLAYLRLKEAYALARGLDEERRTTREAFESFRALHVRAWSGALRRRLGEAGTAPLADAARLLARWVGEDPGSASAVVQAAPDSDPLSCGAMGCEEVCPARTSRRSHRVEPWRSIAAMRSPAAGTRVAHRRHAGRPPPASAGRRRRQVRVACPEDPVAEKLRIRHPRLFTSPAGDAGSEPGDRQGAPLPQFLTDPAPPRLPK
jgi:nitrate reductase assembly molybdenum cofactor insertion protein NarJ